MRMKIKRGKRNKAPDKVDRLEKDQDCDNSNETHLIERQDQLPYAADSGYPVIVFGPAVINTSAVNEFFNPGSVDYSRAHSVDSSLRSSPVTVVCASPMPCLSPQLRPLDIADLSDLSEPEDSEHNNTDQSPDNSLVPVSRPITDYRNNFTEMEGNFLTELLSATNNLKRPFGTVISQVNTFYEALPVLSCARWKDLERFLNAFKTMVTFNDINKQDKYNVIRPGLVKVHHLRGVAGYFNDGHMEYMKVPIVSSLGLNTLYSVLHSSRHLYGI